MSEKKIAKKKKDYFYFSCYFGPRPLESAAGAARYHLTHSEWWGAKRGDRTGHTQESAALYSDTCCCTCNTTRHSHRQGDDHVLRIHTYITFHHVRHSYVFSYFFFFYIFCAIKTAFCPVHTRSPKRIAVFLSARDIVPQQRRKLCR